MRKFLAAVVAVPLAVSADGPCQTSSGVPCFTLTYQHSIWAFVKSPVRNMVATELTGTMSVRADGSTLHRVQPVSRYAVRGASEPLVPHTRLFLTNSAAHLLLGGPAVPADSRLPVLFFAEAAYRRSAASGDEACRAVVASFAKSLEQTGKGRFLDEPVVTWKFKLGYGDGTASLAPGLDCQILRIEAGEYRYGYLPVRRELFEAKSLKRGEPAASLFDAPKGK